MPGVLTKHVLEFRNKSAVPKQVVCSATKFFRIRSLVSCANVCNNIENFEIPTIIPHQVLNLKALKITETDRMFVNASG